jgi:hypothetical protein
MSTEKKKIPHTSIRNIKFKDPAQIALIKKAAEYHDITFNAFVVRVMEHAAVLALQLPQDGLLHRIATRALSLSRKQARARAK